MVGLVRNGPGPVVLVRADMDALPVLEATGLPYASTQVTADAAAKKGMEHGLEKVEVYAKGAGSGRETAIRSLQAAGLDVTTVKDVTPQAHNGCRPRKRRRV